MQNQPVVFITGASTGIGRALAVELAARGRRLALAARRRELLDELAAELTGAQTLVVPCDVSDQAQVKQAIAETVARFGRIDLAILSAGVSEPTAALGFKADHLVRLCEINLFGIAYCLEELIPLMRGQGGGTIAAISSLAADRGVPGFGAYCGTKAALTALFDSLRARLKRHGLRLVTIEPGYVRTPMTAQNKNMLFVVEADDAARLILRRIERGDRVIRFPLPAAMFTRLMRLLPVSLFDPLIGGRTLVKKE